MQLNITQHLIQPRLEMLLLWLSAGAVIWFLPEISGTANYDNNDTVTLMFMKRWEIVRWPLLTSKITAFIVIAGMALRLMQVSERLQIIPLRSTMPIILLIMTVGSIENVQRFDDRLVAVAILLVAIEQIIGMYYFDRQIIAGFNVILLIGLASLFEPGFIWLALLFILGMVTFRVVTQKVFLSVLLGAATFVFLLWGIFWLTGNIPILTDYSTMTVNITHWRETQFTLQEITFAIIISAIFLVSVAGYFIMSGNYNLNVRLNATFTGWGFAATVLWMAVFNRQTEYMVLVPIIFWTLNTGLYFSTDNGRTANITWLIWLIFVVTHRIFFII